jgi:hypothetical protein
LPITTERTECTEPKPWDFLEESRRPSEFWLLSFQLGLRFSAAC